MAEPDFDAAIRAAKAQDGRSLFEHSSEHPLLVTFLRHFGCAFCREACADAAKARPQIEAAGARLAFVFMEPAEKGEAFFAKYGLADVARFSDPKQALYRAFELRRTSFWRMMTPWTIWRYIKDGLGYGVHFSSTDMTQMPGSFLVHNGRIVKSYRHERVSDRPDYCELVRS